MHRFSGSPVPNDSDMIRDRNASYSKYNSRTGWEMAWWIRCWPHKPEDQDSDPQNSHKSQEVMAALLVSQHWEAENAGASGQAG